jgi:hypothetical protein
MSGEGADPEALGWQIVRLEGLEPVLRDYLKDARSALCVGLRNAAVEGYDLHDRLMAINDLRVDAAEVLLPLLKRPNTPETELMAEVLTWSRSAEVGPWLRQWAARRVPMDRRAVRRPRMIPPGRPSVPQDVPYRAILRALRGHASKETEAILLLAARDWDPTYRATAVSSLGWWEPLERAEVLGHLQAARRDGSPEVRQAARAALARLGERQSLHWFRQGLASNDGQRVHETIQMIAHEQLMLMWPDLDRLAEAGEGDVSHHAREALERLSEELFRG